MRVPALILVAVIGILLGGGVAVAEEKVKTNQSTNLLSRPGERGKVLLTVKSGKEMRLLSEDGRWLKVRVSGRTGYVPRSKVDMANDRGIARNTRRRPFVEGRSKKRGVGGDNAPDDRVGADAIVDRGGDEDDEDEEDEEDEKPKAKPKKVAAKTPVKDEDEDEDEEDEEEDEPAPKKVAKATVKTPAKGGDDEDEDEDADEDEAEDDEDAPANRDDEDENPVAAKGGDEPDEAEAARPRARVTKKVSVREDADAESEESFVVRPTDTLYPVETKGDWTFVENDAGDGGWVQSDVLELGESGGGSTGKRVIDVRVQTGIMIIQQGMRTSGSTVLNVPDNYNIGTSAITIALGGGIIIPKGKFLVGGEFTYDLSKTLLGGVYYDADGKAGAGQGVNIGISVHDVHVRGLAGLDLKKKSGMALFARLGYRYQGFLIANVASMTANPAQLPSEVVKGPEIGAALSIPMLTEKLGLRFSLDAMLFGASVTQTEGLEDGATPNAKAIVLGAGLTYRLGTSFDLQALYNLDYMGIDFGAPLPSSTRVHMGTNVKRTDIFHGVTFGIAKPF